MRHPDLVASLREKGAIVWIEGNQLRYRAPKGVLTTDDGAALKVLRDEAIQTILETKSTDQSRTQSCLLPLTAQQNSLWARIQTGAASYRHPCALRLRGAFDPERLKQCVAEVVRRHDSLRTNIVLAAGIPWQHIRADAHFHLDIVDCSGLEESCFDQAISSFALDVTNEGLDMASDPLFSARLLRFSPRHHVLIWGIHHIVSDGFSSSSVFREIWDAYLQFQRGEAPRGAPASAQYADYTLWQAQQLVGRDVADRTFLERSGHAQAIHWPEPEDQSDAEPACLANTDITINDDVRRGLRSLASKSGTSLGITMMALYVASVCRQCQQHDVVVTTAVTGRDRAHFGTMTGYAAHSLSFRVQTHPAENINDVIVRVRDSYQDALSQNISDILAVSERFSQSMFQWMPWGLEEHDGVPSAEVVDALDISVTRIHVPLRLSGTLPFQPYKHMTVLWETASGIAGCSICQPSLLKKGFIQSFVRDFQWQAALAARPEVDPAR